MLSKNTIDELFIYLSHSTMKSAISCVNPSLVRHLLAIAVDTRQINRIVPATVVTGCTPLCTTLQ